MEKGIETNFLQVVMLVSAIVRRISAKRLDKAPVESLNKLKPEQCAETGEQES